METKTCTGCGVSYPAPKDKKREYDKKYRVRNSEIIEARKRIWTQASTVGRPCVICGTQVSVPYSRRNAKKIFCGTECEKTYTEGHSRKVDLVCEKCGKHFFKYLSDISGKGKGRFCSTVCRRTRAVKQCPVCGKQFTVTRIHSNHCSNECRQKARVWYTCLVCGKPFSGKAGKANRFCSPSCYRRFNGETEPEANTRKCLETLGVFFIQEHVFPGWKYPVDFYLPHTDTVVEVDGVYWHKTNARDGQDDRKTNWLKSKGHKVIRIPDTSLYGEVTDAMIAYISEAVCK